MENTLNNSASSLRPLNSFQQLTGELCRLNNSCSENKTEESPQANEGQSSGSMGVSFDGFQNTVEQQYSLPMNEVEELLTMLVDVLEDIFTTVINDFNADKVDEPSASEEDENSVDTPESAMKKASVACPFCPSEEMDQEKSNA